MKQRQRSWRPALIGVAGLIAGYYLVPSRLAYDALCSIMGIAGVGLIRPSHNPDRRTRRVCHRLLIGAITAMFVADFSFGLLAIHDAYQTGSFGDALFGSEYLLISVAALDPSMGPGEAVDPEVAACRGQAEESAKSGIGMSVGLSTTALSSGVEGPIGEADAAMFTSQAAEHHHIEVVDPAMRQRRSERLEIPSRFLGAR
jgi:hypothetical protein